MVAAADINEFLAGSDASCTAGIAQYIPNSGNRDFDYALAQTLSRLTDTFNVLPGFTYFSGANEGGAFATNAECLNRSDGTVFFGRARFRQTMALAEHPDVALTAICAHEFAHILQLKRGLVGILNAGSPTVKRSELHADFLAGFYSGMRKLDRPNYPAAVFATLLESLGDWNVYSRNHHGRPDERAAAIVRGYEVAYRERRGFSEAVQIGINYVSAL